MEYHKVGITDLFPGAAVPNFERALTVLSSVRLESSSPEKLCIVLIAVSSKSMKKCVSVHAVGSH